MKPDCKARFENLPCTFTAAWDVQAAPCIVTAGFRTYKTCQYGDLTGKQSNRQTGDVQVFWSKCSTRPLSLSTVSATITQFDFLPYEAVWMNFQDIRE